MRVLDLFSGIGGFSLGLERAGMETVAFCEIDPFCRAVLKKHWPEIPIHDDVRTIDGREYSPDIVCGGYPCQPFSEAGERRGAEDDRHLWPAMFAIIQRCRPAWVIGENVLGHVSLGLDDVLSDLESEGYAAQTFIVPACAVDAPHKRNRVWIVANADSGRGRSNAAGRNDADGPDTGRPQADGLPGTVCSERASRPLADAGGYGKSQPRRPQRKIRRRTGDGCRWQAEPRMGRVADGIPRRVDRIGALGNAVVPQVVEEIGRAIMSAKGL